MGIYPAGNLVRLDTGEIAVVIKPHSPDPYRPHVRVLISREGTRLDRPYDVNLWEAPEGEAQTVQSPADPSLFDIDPLSYL